MGYDVTTRNGYNMHEVISSLQKEIRRGNEFTALYWALECCPKFENVLCRRLEVISHEDIGIGNPLVFSAVPEMIRSYARFRARNNGAAWLVLTNIILLLCRSPKSRISDEFLCCVMDFKERKETDIPEPLRRYCEKHGLELPEFQADGKMDIPHYALDQHTRRGKAMGHGEQHFHDHAILAPLADGDTLENPYKDEAIDRWLGGAKYMALGACSNIFAEVDKKIFESSGHVGTGLFEGVE